MNKTYQGTMEVCALVQAISISTSEYMKWDFATDQDGVE